MKRARILVLALVTVALPAGAAAYDPVAWANAAPERPSAVVVRNATIWTSGPEGILIEADLVVVNGKIQAVGRDLTAPAGALEIDGQGKHVTPGLIDCHSHTGIDGNVNEGTHIVTAEVRIADVLDSEDPNLYRELAGGLTTANVLHGSANAIGGQNAVIKLRWGLPADQLLFKDAPQGIKFALGENPKQSNWNVDERRYPQTRMGVEQVIAEHFEAARDLARKQAAKPDPNRVPPRRDLQLEALAEILDGKRLVHSHSYRADEILMLLGIAKRFGFRVATFQHGLEGYKVADEIAAQGSGASIFTDWWAYKYEVIDAIPWAGSILRDRGVVTSFNSDSNELARRMNLEAAKAVRYGDVPPAEALKFVTLNPAKQLGVAHRIGSLEKGKDGDFVIWSGDPLSTYTVADETWIEGRKYFDRAADLASREAVAQERKALIDKTKASTKSDGEKKDNPPKSRAKLGDEVDHPHDSDEVAQAHQEAQP
jgi:imidazolonepropionase-like amidohydrolase